MSIAKKPVNYLNNKDILKEIHASKSSYCCFTRQEYNVYDIIIDAPNADLAAALKSMCKATKIKEAKELRAARLSVGQEEKLTHKDIPTTDLVFRVMTWDHIPVSVKQPRKVVKKKTAKDIFEFEDAEENLFEDLEDPNTKDEIDDMVHVKVNFPPFQHFKIDENGDPYCVGKSHWTGGVKTGHFSKDHGNLTDKLARMYIMLCEKYAMKFNWRGYCVDEETTALTKRGWLNIDNITTNDEILSFNGSHMVWSSVHSIFRDNYDGKMFKLTNRNVDMLITPGHKLVTTNGLKKVEFLTESDRLILMGEPEQNSNKKYPDELVELAGWIFTEGHYAISKDTKFLRGICLWQNEGKNAERIRNCITKLGYKFYERYSSEKNICFSLSRADSRKFFELFPIKNLSMNFICDLTTAQRDLLIDTMVEADGWYRGKNRSYTQKDISHMEAFQALCAISGIRTKLSAFKEIKSFGKTTNCHELHLYSKKNNISRVENINMHGAKQHGRTTGSVGKGKQCHPNIPTVDYSGRVWCPKTDFGCFLAKRNNHIYLTGNTYNDEMRNSAILQLTYVGLRFNEAKSSNPFAYYTAAITNSFCRVLNTEKRNQNIRDDILEMHNLTPSFTRQMRDMKFDEYE